MTYDYSFIVPVYNAQEYLDACIQSVLKQGERCELILIDDGSTDLSGKICDDYAQKYAGVRVFHKENAGPAAARNDGCDAAVGKYCIFVDSDDYVGDTLIRNFEAEAAQSQPDVVFFDIVKLFPGGKLEPMAEGLRMEAIRGKSKSEVLAAVAGCPKFPASTGGKIIKTALLKEHHIRFAPGLIGEDIDWTLQIMRHMTSADVLSDATYYYRIHPNTRRSFGKEKSLADQLTIIENWVKIAQNEPEKENYLSCLAFQYAVCLPFYGGLPKEKRLLYAERIRALRFLLKKGRTAKIRLVRLAVSLLGCDKAARLLYRYVVKRDGVNE